MALLSAAAVFIGLWLTGVELNISALMGTTMVVGIVTEIAIFYFSEYRRLVKESTDRIDALIEAGAEQNAADRHDDTGRDSGASSAGFGVGTRVRHAATFGDCDHIRADCSDTSRTDRDACVVLLAQRTPWLAERIKEIEVYPSFHGFTVRAVVVLRKCARFANSA